jgi:hypothetical protein
VPTLWGRRADLIMTPARQLLRGTTARLALMIASYTGYAIGVASRAACISGASEDTWRRSCGRGRSVT